MSIDEFTFPPADSCCLCGLHHTAIGGKRIVISSSGFIYWTLDMEYAESLLNSDSEIASCRQDKFNLSKLDTAKVGINSKDPEVFLRLVGDIAFEQPFQRAAESLKSGRSPWYCQCCIKQACRICEAPFPYPGPCEFLDDQGQFLHIAASPIIPECINPTCVNSYQALLTRYRSGAIKEGQFSWELFSSTYIRERRTHFTWNPASRGKFGDKLPAENIEKRKPLFWLTSIGHEPNGREIYLVNDSGETLDYVWSLIRGNFHGEDTEYEVADCRYRYTTIKNQEAVKVEELGYRDFDQRPGTLLLRLGSKNFGPLSFSVPYPDSFDDSVLRGFDGRSENGLLWVGEEPPRLKTLYVYMDNVLVDFKSVISRLTKRELVKYYDRYDEVPGIFSRMDPVAGAIEAFQSLCFSFDVYILSTAPWGNPRAWMEKVEWVKEYLGNPAYKRLILSHHKGLNKGDILIDDRTENGAGEFVGELIQLGSEKFPDWQAVLAYLG